MEEIRKEIPWLPEWKYFVSNLGRVKSKRWIMKFERNRYWHNRIKLYWAWGRTDVKHYQVHRLVYCVFNNLDYYYWLDKNISKCEWLVLHKDNNPDNNSLDNLYVWTQKDNMSQCVKDWRIDTSWFIAGKFHKNLTEDLVLQIIQKSNQWMTWKDISKEYWIWKDTVYNIINWKTRKHVARKTSDEFGETPTGTIPSQAPQGWEEGVETNSIPLEQWWSWHERPTSNES